ncbi:hypothetical protein WKW79_33760 [Variovorax robiniae]|uniref:Uncharacterized protein n=1 Tax=Variovorax robiniae TaxID=1836199 RepID=A0ABU8XJ09_9BURK
MVHDALVAVNRGEGMPPDTCHVLVQRGFVEWVDADSGLPTHENSPRSLLQMTSQGRARPEASVARLAST